MLALSGKPFRDGKCHHVKTMFRWQTGINDYVKLIFDCWQMETMKSKPGCLAVIDELSKLEVLLKEAAAEEVNAAKAKWQEEAAKKEAEADAKIAALEALVATTAAQSAESPEPEAVPSDLREKIIDETIEQLVPLIYFSRVYRRPLTTSRCLCLMHFAPSLHFLPPCLSSPTFTPCPFTRFLPCLFFRPCVLLASLCFLPSSLITVIHVPLPLTDV